jgi:hypothetical protein
MRIPISVNHNVDVSLHEKKIPFQEIMFRNHKHDAKFCNWLYSLGIEIQVMRLFLTKPYHQYSVHVDISDLNDQTIVLNFAFDDAGTNFSWYTLKKDIPIETTNNSNGIPVYFFRNPQCDKILQKEILHEVNQPFLFNTGYLHSLKAANTNRYCFSYFLRYKSTSKLLQWDDAVKIFEPYFLT